jgi:hypothetical protein
VTQPITRSGLTVERSPCAILSRALAIGGRSFAVVSCAQENILPTCAVIRLRVTATGGVVPSLRRDVPRVGRAIPIGGRRIPCVAYDVATPGHFGAFPRYLLTRARCTRVRSRIGAGRKPGIGRLLIEVSAPLIEIAQLLIPMRGCLISIAARLIAVAQLGLRTHQSRRERFISHGVYLKRSSTAAGASACPCHRRVTRELEG